MRFFFEIIIHGIVGFVFVVQNRGKKTFSLVAAFQTGLVTWKGISVIQMCVSEWDVLKITAVLPQMANSSSANPLEEIFI